MAVTNYDFNSELSPKAKTKLFKIYANVGTKLSPTWELEGRGVTSWTVTMNQDITKEADVLGLIDMERPDPQPTQEGVVLTLRKENALCKLVLNAWISGDTSKIDDISLLLKFEFIDGETTGNVVARREDECMIAINNFNGEANGYLSFDVTFHYANKFTLGEMAKADGETITFIPNGEDEDEEEDEEEEQQGNS